MGAELIDDVPERVAVAFQHARLQILKPRVLPDVATGLEGADADERARQALRSVGFEPDAIGGRRVDDLSGGEMRRVARAGLIARAPELLVLDEPFAGLDDMSRDIIVDFLSNLRRTRGVTTVVVSHDLEDLSRLGDRLIKLEGGVIVAEEPLGS